MFSLKDTVSPLGYLMPLLRFCSMSIEGEGTPLPEGFDGGEGFEGIETVESLAEAYKGAKSKTFVDFLGEEAKNDPNITKYKTGEDLYKGHKSAVEMVGKKGTIVPGEHATPEEVNKFRRDIGVPEKLEDYKFTPIRDLHPKLKITPETETNFKTMMHKHGIPVKTADGIFQDYFGQLSQGLVKQDEQTKVAREQSETKLRNEWGQDYPANLTMAKRLVEKFGGKDAVDAFGELGNNPAVLRTLAGIGKAISEDTISGIGNLSVDAGGAKARIKQIEADPAFMNESDPRHDALVKENTDLYKVAYPSE